MPIEYRRFYYRVFLRCDYGPDEGQRRMGVCTLLANNSVNARRRIIEFVAEVNRPPITSAMSLAEVQHINDNWDRWVVTDIEVTDPFEFPAGPEIYWDHWDELPAKEEDTDRR